MALGGLTLPGLLRAEAAAGRPSHKSVIMVYLSGGLAHQDTFDLKPERPGRGPRRVQADRDATCPASRSASSCRGWPQCMDKLAVVRSLVGLRDEHSQLAEHAPASTMDVSAAREQAALRLASIARVQGPIDPVVPPFVDLFPTMQHKPYNTPGPGQLGPRRRRGARWTATSSR